MKYFIGKVTIEEDKPIKIDSLVELSTAELLIVLLVFCRMHTTDFSYLYRKINEGEKMVVGSHCFLIKE